MNNNLSQQIKEIRDILHNSRHAVFFGGAGVSTESGIPDFRGAAGLYKEQSNEYFLSRSCLYKEPEKFFEFYRKNMIFPDAKPNKTHLALAQLEEKGIIKAVITQNIDGLHQAAGSQNVIELHGTTSRCYCTDCRKSYAPSCINDATGVPRCSCGGIIRPDVTLYEENLDGFSLFETKKHIDNSDVLIAGGTSLNVFPAASFVAEYQKKHLIIINLSPTPYDHKAEYVINAKLSTVFEGLL